MKNMRRLWNLWKHLVSSWFSLTLNEQKALLLILALFLLGLAVRAWHTGHAPILP